jgi:hypothetical protein
MTTPPPTDPAAAIDAAVARIRQIYRELSGVCSVMDGLSQTLSQAPARSDPLAEYLSLLDVAADVARRSGELRAELMTCLRELLAVVPEAGAVVAEAATTDTRRGN